MDFDKKKVKIGEEVELEKDWYFVEYNGKTVGQIYFTKTFQGAVSNYCLSNDIKGKTRKQLAENLCRHIFEEVEHNTKYLESIKTLLNNKQN